MSNPDYGALIENGLGQAARPKRVAVIGAGMAGLVAAYELKRAGHEVTIIEARARVGGRIYTLREPFTHGLFGEAGAMRIPRGHDLTMAYVNKFGLTVSPFTTANPRALCFIEGEKHRLGDVEADPDCLGFEVAENERGQTPTRLWENSLEPITKELAAEGEAAWPAIIAKYDSFSLRDFLEANHWSEGAIEYFGLMAGYESRMNSSFVDILQAEVGHAFTDVVRIDGGMDNLPNAFLPALQDRIRFGARMIAIDQGPDHVTIHYETLAGRAELSSEYAIITLPFAVLRHVEALKPFSHAKQRAIRELHYDASSKIFLQCRRRFWEEDDGIAGGNTVTDLAIRNMYYPDQGRETGRGVLLASYTWAEDAQRWGSLQPADRLIQAVEEVSRIHPQIMKEFEVGASVMWHDDELAGGAFALFDPEQKTQLYPSIIAPEGRIHFAGEHASEIHRWIQGAIQSGLRAASEVHMQP